VAPPGYYQAPPPVAQPAPPPSYASPPPPQQSYIPPPEQSYATPPPVPPAPAPTPNTNLLPPQPTFDAFNGGSVVNNAAPDVFGLHNDITANEDPFAPKPPPPPSHEDLASAILASYQTTQDVPTTPGVAMVAPQTTETMNGSANVNPERRLSMNALAITSTEEKEPKSEFEKALTNLVNVDHIDEPAEGEVKLTMMKKEEAAKTPKGKSIPKPPAGKGMAGSNAPLSQIKQDFVSEQKSSSEGIMNAPPPGAFSPGAVNAGALVVHGNGPPPLQQMQGFGAGTMLPNGGFQNQQNLAPGQHYYR